MKTKPALKKKSARKPVSKNMDPVVHFEFPGEDRIRMSKFYEKAFGWKTQMLGEENDGYVLASTGETDEKGHPTRPGMINGGFFQKDESKPAQYPSVVIAVKSIRRAMKKVAQAGGEVLGDPMDIPGYGKYVSFYDTEGNRIAMMEPYM